MAPVLQCPDCGEKHPLARVPGQGAFPCQGCGRILKVPEVVTRRLAGSTAGVADTPAQASSGAPAPAPAPVTSGVAAAAAAPAPVPAATPPTMSPAPPIPPAERPVPIATAYAGPNVAADPLETSAQPPVDDAGAGRPGARGGGPVGALAHVPWWVRLLLWVVAVPLSFLVVFLIARALHLFTTNQLSDVFLASNTGRFWPVLRLLPFVALVTAGFVQAGVYLFARVFGRSRSPRAPKGLSDSLSQPPA